jgi:hypothetical protein
VLKAEPIRKRRRKRKRNAKKKRRRKGDSSAKRTREKRRTSPKRKRMDSLARYSVEKRSKKKYRLSPTFHPPMDVLQPPLFSVLPNLPSRLACTVCPLLEYHPPRQASPTITLDTPSTSNEPSIDLVTLSSPMLVDLCLNRSSSRISCSGTWASSAGMSPRKRNLRQSTVKRARREAKTRSRN